MSRRRVRLFGEQGAEIHADVFADAHGFIVSGVNLVGRPVAEILRSRFGYGLLSDLDSPSRHDTWLRI